MTAKVTSAVTSHEMPVERDIVQVHVVSRRQPTGEAAGQAVELHDDADRAMREPPR